MKVRVAHDPSDFRCPGKRLSRKANWCYQVAKSNGPKKGFVVRIQGYGHLIAGHLIGDCRTAMGTGSGWEAHVFKSAEEADRVAQKCILYNRKPQGKDVKAIYKKVRGV
jgi:hypothetical protein